MVAAVQAAYMCARNSFGIQANMRKRRDLVLAAMIEKDRNPFWEANRNVRPRLNVFAAPSALANEWSCDQENCSCALGRQLRENIDEYRSADRVADKYGARPKHANLPLQHRFPSRVTGIALVRHDRVADLVTRSKFFAQAFDKLVVPIVMGAIATTLNKQHLPCHRRSSHDSGHHCPPATGCARASRSRQACAQKGTVAFFPLACQERSLSSGSSPAG